MGIPGIQVISGRASLLLQHISRPDGHLLRPTLLPDLDLVYLFQSEVIRLHSGLVLETASSVTFLLISSPVVFNLLG